MLRSEYAAAKLTPVVRRDTCTRSCPGFRPCCLVAPDKLTGSHHLHMCCEPTCWCHSEARYATERKQERMP